MSNEHAQSADESGSEEDSDAPADRIDAVAPEDERESPEGTRETSAESGHGADLTTNELFELLASPDNRYVLTFLLRRDSRVEFGDIVEHVVEQAGPPEGTTPGKFRGRIATRLVHTTLPRLAEYGLLEYDTGSQVVQATAEIERVAPYLDLALSQTVQDD